MFRQNVLHHFGDFRKTDFPVQKGINRFLVAPVQNRRRVAPESDRPERQFQTRIQRRIPFPEMKPGKFFQTEGLRPDFVPVIPV